MATLTAKGERAIDCVKILNEWWKANNNVCGWVGKILKYANVDHSDGFFEYMRRVRVVESKLSRLSITTYEFPNGAINLLVMPVWNYVTEEEHGRLLSQILADTGFIGEEILLAIGYHEDPERWDFVGGPDPFERMLARRAALREKQQ